MNSHEAWVAQLDGLSFEFDIAVGLSGRSQAGWDLRMRPVPRGGHIITISDALAHPQGYDAAIAHSMTDLLDIKSLDIPKLFVIHSTLEGRLTEQRSELTPAQFSQQAAVYLRLIRAHVVAVSKLKRSSWNLQADLLGFCVNPKDYPVATQEEPQGLRISNHFNLRRNVLLADFHDEVFRSIPVEFVGVNEDMEGVTPAADWEDLKKRIARSRFYIHTAHPDFEDGYNMATVEAMATGLPVLGNEHPTSVVEHGVSGFLSDDPGELRGFAEQLLQDRELSRKMGLAARHRAAEVFSKAGFEAGLTEALRKARKKFLGKRTSGSRKRGKKRK